MLRIDRMTDYAAVVLAELRRHGGPSTATCLAVRTGLTTHTASRVLKLLAGAGFVMSSRGRNGGYRPADRDVSLLELIEALEGRTAVTPCVVPEDQGCASALRCPCAGRWSAVNSDLRATLAKHSVDVLAARNSPCGAAAGVQALEIAHDGLRKH